MILRPMTIFWSRAHLQGQVTICLMKFAVGERNLAIRYSFCVWLCNMNIIIVNPNRWTFTNKIGTQLLRNANRNSVCALWCYFQWPWVTLTTPNHPFRHFVSPFISLRIENGVKDFKFCIWADGSKC